MKQEVAVKESVKHLYGKVVSEREACFHCSGDSEDVGFFEQAVFLGYPEDEIRKIPPEALTGLGSGNPLALIQLREGQTVLDLGSGAGLDCFLAARKVGSSGWVIGIDMTGEMVRKARMLAHRHGYKNVEFTVGEIEALPLDDESVEVVVSNCVIHLTNTLVSFKEAHRVLKSGGSMVFSDIVADGELSEYVKWGFKAWTGCPKGLVQKQEYSALLQEAGFVNVEMVKERPFPKLGIGNNSGEEIKSIQVRALKG